MNFEKYIISDTPATEGFLGSLGSIPTSEIQRFNTQEINQEIYALEAYADAIIQNLYTTIAMESTGDGDRLSSIAEKARMAEKKIKEGKSSNNPNLVAQGSNELSASMRELNSESRNAKDPKTKAKVWMVAKVLGAIVASVLLIFGAVTAGKALSNGVKSNNTNDLKSGSQKAKQTVSSDPIMKQMNQVTKDLEEARKQQAVNSANLKKLASEMEATAKMAADLQKSAQKARESGVPEDKILKNKSDVDKYFTGNPSSKSTHLFDVRMPDGSIKKMTLDEAMKSNGTLQI